MKTFIFPQVYLAFISTVTAFSSRFYINSMSNDYEIKLKTRNL